MMHLENLPLVSPCGRDDMKTRMRYITGRLCFFEKLAVDIPASYAYNQKEDIRCQGSPQGVKTRGHLCMPVEYLPQQVNMLHRVTHQDCRIRQVR